MAGVLTTFTTPLGCITKYRYTSYGPVDGKKTYLNTIEDPRGYVTTYEYNNTDRKVMTMTETTVNPFQFCGAWGYYKDSTERTYVRARTLRTDLTRWVNVDPVWVLGSFP